MGYVWVRAWVTLQLGLVWCNGEGKFTVIIGVRVSAGSILDISKYRDNCERSISILGGIAILRYIEYRMNQ